ncbi:MAG: hypothetical protein ACXWYD_16405 [Candidatus Binatia bacterium]
MTQAIPKGYFAKNIDALGYHDLNGMPAFKLAMQEKIAAGSLRRPPLASRLERTRCHRSGGAAILRLRTRAGKYLDHSDPGHRR